MNGKYRLHVMEGEGASLVSCKNLGLEKLPKPNNAKNFFMLMNVERFEIILYDLIFYIIFWNLGR